MKLVTIGDSITKGTFTPRNGAIPDNVADPSFSTLLKERLGANSLVNYGMNGISYCSRTDTLPEYALARQVEALVPGDVTVLAAGTNDFGTGVPLGTAADREDVSFYGAADLVFRRLREKAPEGRFFVVTPIPRSDYERNRLGLLLDDYRDALAAVSRRYGFALVDGRTFPVDPRDPGQREAYMFDGVHPGPEGHRIYGDWLFSAMTGGEAL